MYDLPLTRSLVPFTALAAALAFAPAGVAQSNSFTAGHVVVNSPDDEVLREYLIDGTFVREFGSDSDLSQAQSMVIGPNGILYAACYSPGKILMYGGDGAQIDEITNANLTSGRGLALSSNGIYAVSYTNDRICEFSFDGNFRRTFGAGTALVDPVGIAVGAGGHIFAGSISQKVVHEFDVDGGWLRSFGAADAPHCNGLNIGPDGLLWVASYSDGSIMRFNAAGQKVSEDVIDQNGVEYFEFGPDGNLMVSNSFYFTQYDADGVGQNTFGGGHTHGGAIVPYRFSAQLSGVISEVDKPSKKLKLNKSIVLTYWPAQGTAAISLEVLNQADVTQAVLDYVDLVQETSLVFHGDEARASAIAKGRAYNGAYIPRRTMENGVASLQLGLTGKTQIGYWRPTKLNGAFTFSRNGKVFRGTIKTKKLING